MPVSKWMKNGFINNSIWYNRCGFFPSTEPHFIFNAHIKSLRHPWINWMFVWFTFRPSSSNQSWRQNKFKNSQTNQKDELWTKFPTVFFYTIWTLVAMTSYHITYRCLDYGSFDVTTHYIWPFRLKLPDSYSNIVTSQHTTHDSLYSGSYTTMVTSQHTGHRWLDVRINHIDSQWQDSKCHVTSVV